MDSYRIRKATPEDAATIAAQRRAMFEDMGDGDPDILDWMVREYAPHVRDRIASGAYHGWLAEDADGQVVGGAGIDLIAWPAHPYSRMKLRPTVMNVYVRPEHRRRGLARRLVKTVIAWARECQITYMELSASAEGRALYESLGFQPIPTLMSLDL